VRTVAASRPRFDRAAGPGKDHAASAHAGEKRVVGEMSEFQQEIQIRLESAGQSLAEAQAEGDDYLAQIRLGEIESLQRLAQEHCVA
jgi:hypothetical protein